MLFIVHTHITVLYMTLLNHKLFLGLNKVEVVIAHRVIFMGIMFNTGCLVMNATKVFSYCIGYIFVPRPKICGKSALQIGHFDIL